MKNKLNLLLVAATVASLGSALSSCKKDEGEGVVRLLNFKPEIANNWGTIISKFKEDTGLTLIVETAAEGKYEERLRQDISTDAAPTIFQVNGPIGQARWQQYCQDMSSYDIVNKLKDTSLALTVDGKVYGVPTTVEGYGIIYNKAITDKYFALANRSTSTGVSSMDEINSYTKLKAVVEDMQAHKTDLGIDGVFSGTGMDGSTSWRISGHLFNMPLVAECGNATSTPAKLEFTYNQGMRNLLDLYVKNSNVAINQQESSTWDQEATAFATEKTAMVQNGIWATNDLTGKEGAKAKASNLRYLPLYTGVTNPNYEESSQGLCVGTEAYWTINAKTSNANKNASVKFLEWLFDGNGKQYAVDDIKLAPPFKGFTGDSLTSSDALHVEMNRWLSMEGKKSVTWDFPLVPSTDAQRAPMVEDIKKYYTANLSDAAWNTLVNNVKTTWENLAKAA